MNAPSHPSVDTRVSDFIVTAPADKVSGADFLRSLRGLPPLTDAEKAEREAEKCRLLAESEAQHQRDMIALRKRILAQFSPEGVARMLAKWEAEGVDLTALTECQPDPMRRQG